MSLVIRPWTTADDFRAFAGCDIPDDYSICAPVGYAAEYDGKVFAVGLVTWDRCGRAWGWVNTEERLPPIMLHRRAKRMIAILREVGEPFLLAMCSTTIAGSEKWLDRLGFRPAPELTTDPAHPVWRCQI